MTDGSESRKKLSEGEEKGPKRVSVYDFLYYDVRRVASFNSQLNEIGDETEVTQSSTVTKGRSRTLKGSAGVKIGEDVSGEVALERGPAAAGSASSQTVYDPLWTKARDFLNRLEEHKLIETDPWAARFGQFVLLRGKLIVLDLAMMKNAWGQKSIQRLLASSAKNSDEGNRQQRRAAAVQTTNLIPQETQLVIGLLSIMPHAIQAHLLLDDGNTVWFTLSQDSLVGQSSDLMLKHGSYVPGQWAVVGVLDAMPQNKPKEGEKPLGLNDAEQAVVKLAETQIGSLTARLSPVARRLLGRPDHTFGVTPLLIFRDVGS